MIPIKRFAGLLVMTNAEFLQLLLVRKTEGRKHLLDLQLWLLFK